MLEVCVDNLESAINAVHNEANELEVCSCLSQGGLTPTPGLVNKVIEVVDLYMESLETLQETNGSCRIRPDKRPKVNVMIRCRPGADFCYSELEVETMLKDIDIFKSMGVDRFVFGCLTEAQQVDDVLSKRVLQRASPTPVTFHRAFDLCTDPVAALDKIIHLGFTRLLTSGQKPSADNSDAVELIKTLVQLYGDKIQIMPGAGVNISNVQTFFEIGCKIVHSSCKKLKPAKKFETELDMGCGDYIFLTDGEIVRRMKLAIFGNI